MKRTMESHWMRTLLVFLLGVFASASLLAQSSSTMNVKGVVKDNLGPVIGASIIVEGTSTGTVTDYDGRFELKVPENSNLHISFIGYTPQTVRAAKGEMIIVMSEDAAMLDEVVVIGYGSVKKKDATGSLTAIKVEELNKGLATNPQDLLRGKIAGVSVTSSGGRPGEGSSIRIRGGSSLTASNDPMVIIDGVIMSNDLAGSSNFLSTLNPADIETYTVLKDASSTAIYGSRASNGVILITTKRGVIGKPKVTYNANFSINTKRNSLDVLNADKYYRMVSEKFAGHSNQDKVMSLLGNANTDWQKEIFRNALATDHNVSVAGSVGKVLPYRASMSYTNEEGILKTSNFERVTANVVLNPSFFDNHLNFTINGKGMYSKTRFAETGAIGAAVAFDPTQPVYNNSKWGNFYTWLNDAGTPASIATKNPVAMLKMQHNQAHVRNFIGNIQTDYKLHFFPDLRLNLNVAVDIATTTGQDYKSPFHPIDWNQNKLEGGNRKRFNNSRNNQLLEFYAQYAKDVESLKSKFDVMGGYSWQRNKKDSDELSYYVSQDDNSDLELRDDANHYDFKENYLVSFFGRFNYTFNEKYLLTFTMRNDGSSRFAKGNRWGLFPSVALAWRMKDESFLKDINAISDLKLRVGWGKTGQQDLGDDYMYPSTPFYNTGKGYGYFPMGVNENGTINWVKQMRPSAYNDKLKWESTDTWNVGVDYGFLNNRINGALDVYYRKTTDLLNKEAPAIAGAALAEQIPQNIGNMENKGVEFSINAIPVLTKDFEWDLGFNITYNKSEITKLTANEDPGFTGQGLGSSGGDGGEYVQRYIKGYAPRTYYVYEQVYDKNGKPMEGIYVDRNGDGIIDEDDKYLYKKPDADVYMGFSSKFIYKNWDFGFNGRVSLGNYVYNAGAANQAELAHSSIFSNSIFLSNKPVSAFDTNFQAKQLLSDYYVQNASFLRIDNITLGYTLDHVFKNKLKARVYATVENPIVITEYDGLDPEVFEGIDHNFYPRPIRFMVGFNLNF